MRSFLGCAIFAATSFCAGAASSTLPDLPASSPYREDVSAASIDPSSALIIQYLVAQGGWGPIGFRIDFSTQMMTADGSAPRLAHVEKPGYYTEICDSAAQAGDVPIPPLGALGGHIAWADSVACSGDCRLLVHDTASGFLYEAWDTSITVDPGTMAPDSLSSTCLVTWDLEFDYGANGRGDGCASTLTSGLPAAPLLIDADEVTNDTIDHALLLYLPNNRIAAGRYRHPASAIGAPSSIDPNAPPIGTRFRLKAGFDTSAFPTGVQPILAAMKTYGLILAEGGNVPLSARSDTFTTAKWDALGIATTDLLGIEPSDFEVVGPFGPSPNEIAPVPACALDDNPHPTDAAPVASLGALGAALLALGSWATVGIALRRQVAAKGA
ncbi:MAG: hypothetical protein R3F21_21515 [Myxococcota bacterium]